MKPWKYCPQCSHALELKDHNKQKLLTCGACGFIHYDNPVPVTACIVPKDGGVVVVQRKNPPFKGEWCLPCGFMDQHGHPKAEACREVLEETGLVVRLEKILCACNPMPGEINQITISYLARIVGGEMKAGDDAADIMVAGKSTKLCFRSHRMLLANWFDGVYGEVTGKDLVW